MSNNSRDNINRVVPVDLASVDFEPIGTGFFGFFIRTTDGGVIKYCPVGNTDAEFIIKTFDPSVKFEDPEVCRKIFKTGTSATNIFAGYGL